MKAFARAVLILAKSLNRIAKALEQIAELYRLSCRVEGIEIYQKSKNPQDDAVELSYQVRERTPLELWRER